MNTIQRDENSFLNSRTVFEKVGPTISKCFSSTRACAWGNIVPFIRSNLHYLSRFKQNTEINAPLNSKLKIICPNPEILLAEQDSTIREQELYENMWIVEKHEFDTCKVNTSISPSFTINRNLLRCDTPYELKYYEMVFRTYSIGNLEFMLGKKYYFIGKNSVSSYDNS